MKSHIKPEFGKTTIQQADLFRFQRFFNGLAKKGICLESVKQIRQLLNQFYSQYLLQQGLAKENPLDKVKIQKIERNEAERNKLALTPELRSLFVKKVQDNPILQPIITVLMFTGMRPGELIALTWRDINFKQSTISIRYAASREIDFNEDGTVKERRQVISNTKTVLSVRSFKVGKCVMESLQNWKEYQQEQAQKNGIELTALDTHVFCQKKGEVRTYSGLRSLLKRFLAKHDLVEHGINLYTFRHTFATMLLEKRENPKIVSELMGHAKVLTTLSIYSHVVSNSVYESTAQTLDTEYSNLSLQKEKTDKPNKGLSV